MGTQVVRVAVIEDHPLFRQGLVQVIAKAQGIDLVAAVESLAAMEDIGFEDVDVVILDLHLPDCEGADAVVGSGPSMMPFWSFRRLTTESTSWTRSLRVRQAIDQVV